MEKPKHYNTVYIRNLTSAEIEAGRVEINLDPYRIGWVYNIGGGAREQIMKKALRWTAKGHDERQVIKEIMQACERHLELLDEDSTPCRK